MKMLVSALAMGALPGAGAAHDAHSAAGWTDYGLVKELNQQPNVSPGFEMLFITLGTTTNPSVCSLHDGFYMTISTDQQKRLFAMLMTAKTTGTRVKVYVTDNCHLWGNAEMQGLVME